MRGIIVPDSSMCKGPEVRSKMAQTKAPGHQSFGAQRGAGMWWKRKKSSGPCGLPERCAFYPLSSKMLLWRVWVKESKMIPLNPGPSNKKQARPHMRWEPIEISTKGRGNSRYFRLIMQNCTAFQGRGERWKKKKKKSQQITLLICFKLLKCLCLPSIVTWWPVGYFNFY